VLCGGPEGDRTLDLCVANYVLALSTRVRTRLISYPSWALSHFRFLSVSMLSCPFLAHWSYFGRRRPHLLMPIVKRLVWCSRKLLVVNQPKEGGSVWRGVLRPCLAAQTGGGYKYTRTGFASLIGPSSCRWCDDTPAAGMPSPVLARMVSRFRPLWHAT
jgi:hypothetical protein